MDLPANGQCDRTGEEDSILRYRPRVLPAAQSVLVPAIAAWGFSRISVHPEEWPEGWRQRDDRAAANCRIVLPGSVDLGPRFLAGGQRADCNTSSRSPDSP